MDFFSTVTKVCGWALSHSLSFIPSLSLSLSPPWHQYECGGGCIIICYIICTRFSSEQRTKLRSGAGGGEGLRGLFLGVFMDNKQDGKRMNCFRCQACDDLWLSREFKYTIDLHVDRESQYLQDT